MKRKPEHARSHVTDDTYISYEQLRILEISLDREVERLEKLYRTMVSYSTPAGTLKEVSKEILQVKHTIKVVRANYEAQFVDIDTEEVASQNG